MKKSIGSGRGSVYNIILKALQTGDKYGYEICKEVEEKTDGAYILKQPSLYSGLKRLEAQGNISSYWKDSALGGRRHYYTLTKSGTDRINGSDFNWQDARDDIVGSLFEKSQLDSDIENAQNDIELIKSNSLFSQQAQQNIDEVLSKTESLTENDQGEDNQKSKSQVEDDLQSLNDEATPCVKSQDETSTTSAETTDKNGDESDAINPYGDDLFSMFRTVQQTEDVDDKIDDELADAKNNTVIQQSEDDAQNAEISESQDYKSQPENDFRSQESLESTETTPEYVDNNETAENVENQHTENEYLETMQGESEKQISQDEPSQESTNLFESQSSQNDKISENIEQNLDEHTTYFNVVESNQQNEEQSADEQKSVDDSSNLQSDDKLDNELSCSNLNDTQLNDEAQGEGQDAQGETDLYSDENLDTKHDDAQNIDAESPQDENQQMDLFSFATNNIATQD